MAVSPLVAINIVFFGLLVIFFLVPTVMGAIYRSAYSGSMSSRDDL